MIEQTIFNLASAAQSAVSVPFQIDDLTTYSVQVTFSGGAGNLAGVLTLEASNDNVTYITLEGSEQIITNSGNHIYTVSEAGYRWGRCRWDYTSGTGNMTMLNTIKEPRNRY